MARAEETAVRGLWSIEDLCPNCELREGGNRDPDYFQQQQFKLDKNGKSFTPFGISTEDGYKRQVLVSGIPRPEHVSPAFTECEGPEVFEDKIVCGAIAKLSRRNRDGREEV
jgi:hypothetical protein